jgi:hypothetical protein
MEESLRLCRILGARLGIATSLRTLAEVTLVEGHLDRALKLCRESIALRRQIDSKQGMAECMLGLAAIASASGKPRQAARHLGTSDALWNARRFARPPVDQAGYARIVAEIQASLPAEEFAAAWAEGTAMTVEQAVSDALRDDTENRN